MIMPAFTHVTAAKDLQPTHPTVEGPVIRRAAVIDRCDKMCASGKLNTTSAHTHTHNASHHCCPLFSLFILVFLSPNATASFLTPLADHEV